MGDIYLTTTPTNPSSIYLGTTWQKIENRFLLGTSSNGTSKQLGGSITKEIKQSNLPATKIQLNSFSLSKGTMEITGSFSGSGPVRAFESCTGAFYGDKAYGSTLVGGNGWNDLVRNINYNASRSWTGTTNIAQPQTVNLGEGKPLDITPSYYTCHIWLRLS